MKNYRKTVRTLKKARFLSIWAAVFALAASLVLTGCDKLMGKPIDGGTSLQGSKIRIKYNPDEMTIEKNITATGNWEVISSGTAIDEGTELFFKAKNVPSGKVVDKWTLNGKKEIPSNGNSVQYKVNLKDADSENTITVTRTFKDAASITIKYNANEMTIEKNNTSTGEWEGISSGTAVYEGTSLRFKAKNILSGKMLEKWLLNGKIELHPHAVYSVRPEDAVEEGGKKVIKVERILKDAASITIKYNANEMTIEKWNNDNWETLPTDTPVYEGTELTFQPKNGQTVNRWILNGKKELYPHAVYSVSAEDAVEEGSKKVIEVTFK